MNPQSKSETTKQPRADNGVKGATVRLELSRINTADIQIRAKLDASTVGEYANQMQEGIAFPPIVVFQDGNEYYLADGYHRVEAARQCGFLDIDAIVEQGTARDAVWYALGANKAHGLRLSRADVRRAIELALQEFPDRSSRDIAKQIGCDHKTVEAARKTQESAGEIPHVQERTGADGKAYPAHRKPEPAVGEEKLPDSLEYATSVAADQPAAPVVTPVGLDLASKALDILRMIPANDAERPQAIVLVSDWLNEVATISGVNIEERGPA